MTTILLPHLTEDAKSVLEGEVVGQRRLPPNVDPAKYVYFEGCPVRSHPLWQFRKGPVTHWRMLQRPLPSGSVQLSVVCMLHLDPSKTSAAPGTLAQVEVPLPCIYITATEDISAL